jgi:hypothetical protein
LLRLRMNTFQVALPAACHVAVGGTSYGGARATV